MTTDQLLALWQQLDASGRIMVLTALVSLVALLSKRAQDALVLSPYLVMQRGHVHRLLTAGLIHKDLGHLGMNMLVLWFFSRRVLRAFGELRYAILYVTAILAAYVLTTVRFRKDPRYSSLGASGAVAAVMLSAIVLDPLRTWPVPLTLLRIPGVVMGAAYIGYSVLHSWGAKDRINHDAHFTGALYGVAFTYLVVPAKVQLSITVLKRFIGW